MNPNQLWTDRYELDAKLIDSKEFDEFNISIFDHYVYKYFIHIMFESYESFILCDKYFFTDEGIELYINDKIIYYLSR